MTARARVEAWRGAAAVTLVAGDYEAVVVPELAMLVASLRHQGREHVALPGGLRAYRAGHTTGIPLLHPWANRLARRRYRAAGVEVDLRRLPLHTDGFGLPMHGTMTARPGWEVVRLGATPSTATVAARFPFGDHPDLLASFPFPHELSVEVRLGPRGLAVTTSVVPTGVVAVPVSFGWHPYWRLGSPRGGWLLDRPRSRRVPLDGRGIPTARPEAPSRSEGPLAGHDLDDHFVLGPDRTFTLADRTTRLAVTFDAGYPYAQIYSPTSARFCAIEPMTATTNALVTNAHPDVAPGRRFDATFRAAISPS